jgi:hypothetical protein
MRRQASWFAAVPFLHGYSFELAAAGDLSNLRMRN